MRLLTATTLSTLAALSLLAACGGGEKPAPVEPTAAPTPEPTPAPTPEPTPAPEATPAAEATPGEPAPGGDVKTTTEPMKMPDPAPAEAKTPEAAGDTKAMLAILNAKDKAASATKATLDASGGLGVLKQLADSDPNLVVRARALDFLGFYNDAATESYLGKIVMDQGQDPKLRAGAIEGLGRMGLADRAKARAAVVRSLGDSNAAVGVAAVRALNGIASAKADLEKVANDSSAPEPVRNAAKAAIK
jgi:uncharacterized protein (UPF0147 family)